MFLVVRRKHFSFEKKISEIFLFRFQTRRRWSIVFKLFVLGLLTINLIQTSVSLIASHYNYPGANALLKLQDLKSDQTGIIHIDVYSAENGVSRFLETKNWMYDLFSIISNHLIYIFLCLVIIKQKI